MAQLSSYPSRTLAKIAGVDASGNVGLAAAPTGVFYAGANEASILAAAALANAAGGGIVQIPAGTITMSQSLPAYTCVRYVGAPWGTDNRTAGSSLGGTILVAANNTIIGYGYNTADLGVAPTVLSDFVGGMLTGGGLSNLTLSGFSYGVKIGGKYNPGAQTCKFDHLNILNSVNWDFYIENYWCCEFDHIATQTTGVGAVARIGSGATALNCGNSMWRWTACAINAYGSRGICTWGRFASEVNQDNTYSEEIQSSFSTTITQAASMTNTSANIGVTDSTKFPVGMPVAFSATANGFIGATQPATTNQVYFVLTSAANVITVGLKSYGSAVVATGNSAVNVLSKGYPHFEIGGQDAGSATTAINIYSPDTEGNTSARIVLQNASFTQIIGGYIGSNTLTNDYATFVLRTSIRNRFDSMRTSDFDIDSASNATIISDTTARGIFFNPQQFARGLDIASGQSLSFADQGFLTCPAANSIAVQNGTNPQRFKIFNTNDGAGNSEFFDTGWASNTLTIGTDKTGSGSARGVKFEAGGTAIAEFGTAGATVNFYFYNTVFARHNFLADDLAAPSFNPSFGGNANPTFYTGKTSGVILTMNATGANYGSMAINGAQLWGLGSSANGTAQSTNSVQWDGSANVMLGKGSLATNATDGFGYMPTSAGAPTGVPTAQSGYCAFQYDTTNNKLYVYNGAWKSVVLT